MKVAERVDGYDRIAFASTCTTFCDLMAEVVKKSGEDQIKLVTTQESLSKMAPCFTLDWFKWAHGSFLYDRKYKLVKLAFYQASTYCKVSFVKQFKQVALRCCRF